MLLVQIWRWKLFSGSGQLVAFTVGNVLCRKALWTAMDSLSLRVTHETRQLKMQSVEKHLVEGRLLDGEMMISPTVGMGP